MSGLGTTEYVKFDSPLLSEDEPFGIDTSHTGHHWSPPANLDKFLVDLYSYYQGKGFNCCILSGIFNILTFTWMAALLLFLLAIFDISNFTFKADWGIPNHPLFYLAAIISCAAWIYLIFSFLLKLRTLLEMRWFYRYKLFISEEEIPTMMWCTVARKLVKVKGLCRIRRLDELDIVQRIMRKENYMIALFNKKVLALNLPFRCTVDTPVVTKILEWGLSITLFRFLFSEEYSNINFDYEEVLHNASLRNSLTEKLKRRFILVGIAAFILSPFVFIILVIYFMLKYGEELRNKPNAIGVRQWTRVAHWRFREFNELPHELEDRLKLASSPAANYVDQFVSYPIILVCKFVSFVTGSIVICLLVASFFDPDVLNGEIFLGRDGIWWIAVCGSLLALARSFIPTSTFVFQPEYYFEETAKYTHYMPKHWAHCRAKHVISEVSSYYQYRLYVLLLECCSVLFIPLIMLFSLPQCAERIVMFVCENTTTIDGVGEVCSFSNFDFNRHGNKLYGSVISGPTESQSGEGKLEKSCIAFMANYPDWRPSGDSVALADNLSSFLSTEFNQSVHTSVLSRSTLSSSLLSSGEPITSLPLDVIADVQTAYYNNKSLNNTEV